MINQLENNVSYQQDDKGQENIQAQLFTCNIYTEVCINEIACITKLLQ